MTSRELKHDAFVKEWARKIGECRTSGKSVTQWCEENRINTKTYYRWERKCLTEYEQWFPAGQGNLVKIDPAKLPSADSGLAGESSVGISIEVGKVKMVLPSGTDIVKIAELIAEINRHV